MEGTFSCLPHVGQPAAGFTRAGPRYCISDPSMLSPLSAYPHVQTLRKEQQDAFCIRFCNYNCICNSHVLSWRHVNEQHP
mmetsp:Transcript_23127/g.64549  ORF Transcript_23127/g.64549 Transcript_23127/m.64549 type:complete len:80 (+) Transcript_23127:416-655(+)